MARFESYEQACAEHAWNVPERYNIAADVCFKHAPDKPAMIHEHFDGTVREVAWGELQANANRFANVLRAHGVEPGDRVAMLLPPTPETAAAFFGGLGVRIERVMTDNGFAYRSRAYNTLLDELGARHKHTRPYRPQTNGKAERFIKTLLAEWAYARPYADNADRLAALPAYLNFYNHDRPHTALGGLAPMQVLVNNVSGNHS